jgi:DinB family protein
MKASMSPELAALDEAYIAIERDARALADGLTEERAAWRSQPGSWSVAECIDHLATSNRVYLAAMQPPAARALASGRQRRRPALPGLIGGWFVRSLEPPVHIKTKNPKTITPRTSPPFADAMQAFVASQEELRRFLHTYAGIDLAGVRFRNPFIAVVRFSLATGLHVIAAHDRRHLWQAWNVRRAAEQRAT